MNALKQRTAHLFRETQSALCARIENLDGKALFLRDEWTKDEGTSLTTGGGITRVIENGAVFEKGGVNFSEVEGILPASMSERLVGRTEELPFFATGISIVLHPLSPLVPTTHANYRYLVVGEKAWFGGGADLTPYILFEEDAHHFHRVLQQTTNQFNPDFYPKFKKWCDEYFYLPHRKEHRGIGGIFFDYLGRDEPDSLEKLFPMVEALTHCISTCYLPIVEQRMHLPWTEEERKFQCLRRGRYVEFNLLYDRGTQFGLQTGGRTESILMSLPPQVEWHYGSLPKTDAQKKLLAVISHPQEWGQNE